MALRISPDRLRLRLFTVLTAAVLVIPAAAQAEQRTGTATGPPPPPALSGQPEVALRAVTATYSTDGAVELTVSFYAPIEPTAVGLQLTVTLGKTNVTEPPPRSCFLSGPTFLGTFGAGPSSGAGSLSVTGYTGALQAQGRIGPADTEAWTFSSPVLGGLPLECMGSARLSAHTELHCEPSLSDCERLSTSNGYGGTPEVFFAGFPVPSAAEPSPPPAPRVLATRHCSSVRTRFDHFVSISAVKIGCVPARALLDAWSEHFLPRFRGWHFKLVHAGANESRWRATHGHQAISFVDDL